MKKILICIFAIMLLSGCAQDVKQSNEDINSTRDENVSINMQEELSKEKDNEIIEHEHLKINSIIKTDYDTGYKITVKYAISDKDYIMYNDILDALNSDFSKSEDEILAGLTGKYGMSVSQLKSFMTKNMDAAIDRDYGKTIGSSTISDLQVIDCGKQVIINTIENTDIKIPSDTASWDISKTGLRYVLKCSFKVDESNINEAIIKIEFNEDYSKFTLFQLKYNGIDIEL